MRAHTDTGGQSEDSRGMGGDADAPGPQLSQHGAFHLPFALFASMRPRGHAVVFS